MTGSADTPMRLEVLERQFDRIQFLFTRVDAKVNAVLAIASGQIAVASVAVSGGDSSRVHPTARRAGLSTAISGLLVRCLLQSMFKRLAL